VVSPRTQTLELKKCPYGRHLLDSQVPAKVLFLSVRVPRTNLFFKETGVHWEIFGTFGAGDVMLVSSGSSGIGDLELISGSL
jgi:hypothetical protein